MNNNIPHKVIKGNMPVLAQLRILVRKERHGVLATMKDKVPYTSLISLAFSDDLKTLIFATPKDSQKYRNIKANENISILLDSRKNIASDYMKAEAVTILGMAKPVRKGGKHDALSSILSKRHPRLKSFIEASTTALIHMHVTSFVHVSGFQTVTILNID